VPIVAASGALAMRGVQVDLPTRCVRSLPLPAAHCRLVAPSSTCRTPVAGPLPLLRRAAVNSSLQLVVWLNRADCPASASVTLAGSVVG